MIQDLRERRDASASPRGADVCIIGSGAIGTSVAREFFGTGYSVVVLEGGGEEYREESQDPYRGEAVGLPHRGLHGGRARVLGGSTTLWAGQALPLADIDFRARDWVPDSGWPIPKSALLPYYRRAEAVYQVDEGVSYDAATWPSPEQPPPPYDPARLATIYSQFTLTPDFRDKYRAELEAAPNVEVITHANVTALEAGPNADGIVSVEAQTFEGKRLTVRARYVVVACGGIESARLLLLSDSVEPGGVGNRHDVVGRYFQEHPFFAIENIRPADPKKFDGWFNTVTRGQVRYAKKVIATETLQERERILSVVGEIYYPADEDDPLTAARHALAALKGGRGMSAALPSLAKAARDPGRVVREVWNRKVLKQAVSAGSVPPQLLVSVEQEPNPASRVRLGETRDALGQRRIALDWRVSPNDIRTAEVFVRAVAAEWKRLGIADLDADKALAKGLTPNDAFHHIGSTRMGTDPKKSVVDPDCRVHGYDNLYIAGSSVFPTGSFSNPTLTAVALGLRIADTVKARLARPAPSLTSTAAA